MRNDNKGRNFCTTKEISIFNFLFESHRPGQYKGERSVLHYVQNIPNLLDLFRAGLHRHDNDIHRSRYAQQKDYEARAQTGDESQAYAEQDLERV